MAGARVNKMRLTIAAIRTGTEPVGRLPEGAFHRWLDEPLHCPKCDASYNLVVDYDQAVNRFFSEDSRKLILMLKKAIFMGHGDDHRVTHFETEGVVVKSFRVSEKPVAG
jgi:hypothetical protein